MNDGLLPANEPCPKFGAFEVLSDSAQAESQVRTRRMRESIALCEARRARFRGMEGVGRVLRGER